MLEFWAGAEGGKKKFITILGVTKNLLYCNTLKSLINNKTKEILDI